MALKLASVSRSHTLNVPLNALFECPGFSCQQAPHLVLMPHELEMSRSASHEENVQTKLISKDGK
jgi:hypothetical protein